MWNSSFRQWYRIVTETDRFLIPYPGGFEWEHVHCHMFWRNNPVHRIDRGGKGNYWREINLFDVFVEHRSFLFIRHERLQLSLLQECFPLRRNIREALEETYVDVAKSDGWSQMFLGGRWFGFFRLCDVRLVSLQLSLFDHVSLVFESIFYKLMIVNL